MYPTKLYWRCASGAALVALLWLPSLQSMAQTLFLDFNSAGQYTNSFNPFNDVGGSDAGNYAFMEASAAGVGGSRGVSVFLGATANDTTATYKNGSWDLSTNGAALMLSTLIKANGQSSANKVQIGFLNLNTNGFYSAAGVAFESYRIIPQSANTWSLREQYRTANTTAEATLGNVTVVPGNWYKFVVSLTNISGASGNCSLACAIYDYGADGLSPGANIVPFVTLRVNANQDVAKDSTVWPGLRAIQSAGIDAWDNFLVYTPASKPVITFPLSDATLGAGSPANFKILADGPETIFYAWYTNGVLVGGASNSTYTTPPLNPSYTNVVAVASNSKGSTTNSAVLTVVMPSLPMVANQPATGIQPTSVTLNGQVLATGADMPNVTIFYGPNNGGTNAVAWSNSVALGPQNGAFSQAASGLSTNTTYFFTARAVNVAGTAWASPSLSFTTLTSLPPVVAVLTYHNDNARLGVNANETRLTLANVNTNSFGKLFSRPVDDQIYAQPLVMTNVNIPGQGVRNVVYVATVNNALYAFDADDPYATTPYWQLSFLGPGITAPRNTDMSGACGGNYNDFTGAMGIVGTPVIDPVAGTIFLVVRTKEVSGPATNFVQRLHALDLATGNQRPNSPVVITATYPGTGDGSVGGVLTFDPQKQNQRPALALVNGIVYIAWSSHCDWGPYHGWLMGYNAQNLARVSVYNSTPNGGLAGFWQGGGGPAVDASGHLYFITGNGTFNAANNNFGETFLKLATTNGLTRADYFTPYDYATLNNLDADLGAGAAIVLPDSAGSTNHPRLLVGAGKGPKIYLINRDNMGQFNASGDQQIVQVVTNAFPQGYGSGSYSTPAFFNNTLYYFAKGDRLKAFRMSGGLLLTNPVLGSATTAGFGGSPSISANGTNNGIVWVIVADSYGPGSAGTLRAYNATNIAQELYHSSQVFARDNPGGSVKFVVPTVANGKVYVGARNALSVFGNGVFLATPTITPNGGVFTNSIMVSLAVATPGAVLRFTLDGTDPMTNSALYTGPFVLTNSGAVKARAFMAGAVDSGIASATFINSSAIGTGTGLVGSYWSNQLKTFNGSPTLTRTDATVNFNWGGGAPAPSISADSFTARWTGTVQPQFTEPFTFYTTTDDGARLWLNDELIIDKWVDQGPTEWSGTGPTLVAQQKYNLRMEYYENGGGAVAQLAWSSPTVTKSIIPQSQLYPTSNQPPAVTIVNPTNGAIYTAIASVTISALASGPDDSLSRVDFYANSTFLGSVSNSPGTVSNTLVLTATGLTAGGYALTARAFDGAGYSRTSAPVNITVSSGTGAPYGLTARGAAPAFFNMPPTINGSLPAKLSETGVFSDTANMVPVSSLISYDVNVPLWSDAALKTRWLAVPNNGAPYSPDEQIGFAPTGEWSFPPGTVFVKHFYLNTDETNPNITRRLETRLLVRDASNGVYGVTYRWRPDYSDADLLATSLNEDFVITNASGIRTQTWYYPSPADCLTCHTPASGGVLGVNSRQLNGIFAYPATAQADNQLRTLNRIGLLHPAINEASIAGYPRLSALTNLVASLEDRSRSYLDANCAQCHRPGGASHSSFDARYDTPLANQNIVNGAVVTDLGIDNAKVVAPKDIWRSLLHVRGNSVDSTIKMPPLARNLVDTNAMSVIAAWINSLPGTPALEPPMVVPAGGVFFDAVSVMLQHPDAGVSLRYTLDNTLPTTNSPLYAGPFLLTNSVMVKAKAFKVGFNDSAVVSGLFSIRPPVFFTAGGYLVSSGFQLELSGIAGKTYVFQATTDFMNWIPVGTNVAATNLVNFLDTSATNFPHRFYRAVERP